MKNTILLLIMFLFFYSNTQSQNDCANLLMEGIFSYVQDISTYSDESMAVTDICEAYNQYKKTKNTAAANARYKVIFKGNASYSAEDIETIGKMYCEYNFSTHDIRKVTKRYNKYVDPTLMSAYVACQELSQEGIKLDLKKIDNLNREVVVSIRYISTMSENRPRVTQLNYDKSKLQVSGNLLEAANKNNRLNNSMSINIKRLDIKQNEFKIGTTNYLAEGALLTIGLEQRDVIISFPPIYAPIPEKKIEKGVGEIVSSLMDELTFMELYNLNGQRWVLANGDFAPEGSRYRRYLDKHSPNKSGRIPDLRGVFLRGKNYDRDKNTGNPDGDLPIGKSQLDMFKRHHHRETRHDDNPRSGQAYRGGGMLGNNLETINTENTGGNETRPRNVTVNFFIRVD